MLNLHPLVRIALALIIGIVIGDAIGSMLSVWVWLMLAAGSIVSALGLGRSRERWQGAMILLGTLFVGGALVSRQNTRINAPLPKHPVEYEAVVMSEPQVRGKTIACDLLITSVSGMPLSHAIAVKASILRDTVTHRWQSLHLGNGIRAESELTPVQSYYPMGNFSYVRHLHSHGFTAQTFIPYRNWQPQSVSLAGLSYLQRTRLHALKWRERLLNHYRSLGLEDQEYAIIAAMTLGDKSKIDRDTKQAFSISGSSHVLALSGLHLGIIYSILTLLFGRSRRWRWTGQALILTAIWMYAVIVGLPTSMIRATAMISIYSVCILLGRQRASINTLAFAAIIMLIINPLCLWDVGFQMSFMAVLAILIYYPTLFHLLTLQHWLTKWIWGLACVSTAAQIGVAPLVVYYFGRFSCYFLLSNFIVIPSATIILYGAALLIITSPIPLIRQSIAALLQSVTAFLYKSIDKIAALPAASIENIHITTLQLCLIYVVIISSTVIGAYAMKIRHQSKLEGFYK